MAGALLGITSKGGQDQDPEQKEPQEGIRGKAEELHSAGHRCLAFLR